MKSILLLSLLLSYLQVSIQTSSTCTTDSDCGSGQSCCPTSSTTGTCYDPTIASCPACSCDGCAQLPSAVCDHATYSNNPGCCPAYGCYNPNTTLCCSYHDTESTFPLTTVCANDGEYQCCGSFCQKATDTCCEQTDYSIYYLCHNNYPCCGGFTCCTNEGEVCSSGSMSVHTTQDHCVNTTSVPSPTPTSTPTPSSSVTNCGGKVCGNSDACCGGQCYDPTRYSCFENLLCPNGASACGNACYSASSYYCCNNQLYQNGQTSACSTNTPPPYPICGGKTCDNLHDDCCNTVNGVICYDTTKYSCAGEYGGGILCPLGYYGCGDACYSTSQYKCCSNNELVPTYNVCP